MLDLQCSPDVSPQVVGSGSISEPQRGPTVAVLIMSPARNARFAVLPRRLAPDSSRRLLAAPDSSRRLLGELLTKQWRSLLFLLLVGVSFPGYAGDGL